VLPSRWRLDLGAIFVYLALGAMFSAVPRYVTEELDGSKAVAGFGVSIFFLAAVLARPFAGRFVDARGRRPLLRTLPFVIAALIVALTWADHVGVVLAIRFVQGLAGGSLYVAAVTAETDLAPEDRRASAVARLSVFIYLGFAAGPALGELLLDCGTGTAWWVLGAIGAVGGLLMATVPETRPEPEPVAEGAAPLPRSRLIPRVTVLPGLTLLAMGVGYTSVTGLSALYARSIGLDDSTPLYATYALSILVVRLASGRVADAVGPAKVIVPGLVSFGLGFVSMAGAASTGVVAAAVVGVALVGTGWALVFPALIAWVSEQVPASQRGSAMGSLIAFMDIGQGAGGYLVGSVADGAGFAWAYTVPATLAVGGMASILVALGVGNRRRDDADPIAAADAPDLSQG